MFAAIEELYKNDSYKRKSTETQMERNHGEKSPTPAPPMQVEEESQLSLFAIRQQNKDDKIGKFCSSAPIRRGITSLKKLQGTVQYRYTIDAHQVREQVM